MDFFLQALGSAFKLIISLDSEVYLVVWTSIYVSLLATLCASIISIPLGLLVGLQQFPGKGFLLRILNTLMALPTVVVGLIFYGVFSRRGPMGDWGLLYTPAAMVIGLCVLIIPIIWNLSITAVHGADPRLALTCKALGTNGWQQGLIYLNEVRFGLLAAVVIGFGRAIGEVGIAMMLGGNIEGFTRTMTTAIALETSRGEFEFALALGIVLLVVAFAANAMLYRFQRTER